METATDAPGSGAVGVRRARPSPGRLPLEHLQRDGDVLVPAALDVDAVRQRVDIHRILSIADHQIVLHLRPPLASFYHRMNHQSNQSINSS